MWGETMKALILVDIQKDFCKNGALEVKNRGYGSSCCK